MFRIRKLQFQPLEKRELMASDIAAAVQQTGIQSQTVADFIAANPGLDDYFVRQNFTAELGFSFGPVRDVSSVQIGDSIIVVEGRQLRLFAPDDSALGYSQQSLLTTTDRIRNVTRFGDQLLVVTERHNGLQTKFQSTLILATVDTEHHFKIIDTVVRNSQFTAAGATDDGLSIFWNVPDPEFSPELAQAQLKQARFQLDVDSSDFAYSLVDYMPAGATQFDDRPLLSGRGSVSVIGQAGDRLVVRAGDGLRLINATTGGVARFNTGEVTWVNKVSSKGPDLVLEGGMGEPGMSPFMGVHGYGTVVLDEALNIKATSTDFTGDQATLKSEFESFGMVHNDGRVRDVTAYPQANGLRIVTKVGEAFTQQMLDLPGYRVGYTPAFVLDADTIVSVRAYIADVNIQDGAIPNLSLYVLKRNDAGEFETTSIVPLPKFDPRANASVQSDGTITLQNRTQALIIRTENEVVSVQSIDTSADWRDSRQSRRITAIGDIVLYTGSSETQLLNDKATEAYIAPEPLEPESSDAAFITLDLVKEAMNSGAVITDLDLPQSSGEESSNIDVVSNATADPMDVNDDGVVTALDALLIINMLNSTAPEVRGTGTTPLDVNGDGVVTALDSLTVINQLNKASEAVPLSYIEELNRRAKSL